MTQAEKDYWHRAAALEQAVITGRISYQQYTIHKHALKSHYPGGRK